MLNFANSLYVESFARKGFVRENVSSEDDGKCTTCNGTGQVETEWDRNETTDCAECHGTGKF